jgi:hypothetical protein
MIQYQFHIKTNQVFLITSIYYLKLLKVIKAYYLLYLFFLSLNIIFMDYFLQIYQYYYID